MTWLKVLRTRNGAAAVGKVSIPEVEWADWHLIGQWGEGEEGKEGEGSVEGT